VTSAVLSGDLSPEEGAAAARVLMAQNRMIRTVDIDQRLRVLEDMEDSRPPNSGGTK